MLFHSYSRVLLHSLYASASAQRISFFACCCMHLMSGSWQRSWQTRTCVSCESPAEWSRVWPPIAVSLSREKSSNAVRAVLFVFPFPADHAIPFDHLQSLNSLCKTSPSFRHRLLAAAWPPELKSDSMDRSRSERESGRRLGRRRVIALILQSVLGIMSSAVEARGRSEHVDVEHD